MTTHFMGTRPKDTYMYPFSLDLLTTVQYNLYNSCVSYT